MAFERKQAVIPVAIGDIETRLVLPGVGSATNERAIARIQVLMSDGSVDVVNANLAEHFPSTTINQLRAFMSNVRQKAVDEILPVSEEPTP